MVNFGLRLKELRKENELTQDQLAQILGFSKNTIASYEQEKRFPNLHTLYKIANFFDVSTDYLLGRFYIKHINESEINKSRPKNLMNSILLTLSSIIEFKAPYKKIHSKKVSRVVTMVAKNLDLSLSEIRNINIAGLLHNIGEMAIPRSILNKKRKLTEAEFNLLKEHPLHSYNHLKANNIDQTICDIVLQHHEKINGTGYPNKLKGSEILLEARILGVADALVAMTEERPYRQAQTLNAALKIISQKSSSHYDPEIVETVINLKTDLKKELSSV